MVAKKCLICCGESFPKKTGTQDANSTSFSSAENFNGQQAEGLDNGDTELQILFLLRKLLEIPEETCCLLRDHFGKASLWIECCDSCLDLVEKCKAALEQAELFQKQYEELRSNIKTTMLKSPKKPFSAESKCEAIVRSILIAKEIDNFISTNGPETEEENFPNENVNFDPNISPEPVDSEDSQVLAELGSITPVVIDEINTVKNEDDIIISFHNVTENFINIPETEAYSEIFPDGNAFDHKLTAPVIPPEATEVLTGSITPVQFEMINTVKSEEEVSINESDDMDCNLESSNFGKNVQSGNTSVCAKEQNKSNFETVPSDTRSKSANEKGQLVLPGQSNKSPRGSKSSLNTAEEARTSKRSVKSYAKRKNKCHVCSKFFKLPQHLKNHLRSHSGTNKGTFTKRKGNLRKQPRKHTTKKKHKCDICDKSYRWLYLLKMHKAVHSNKRPFVCDICSKGFTSADYLRRHCIWHSGERSFECDVCEKAFVTKAHLKNHQMTHSRKKPLKCDICDKSFKWKRSLILHCKKHDEETS